MNKYGQMDIFDFLPNPVYNPIFDFLSTYGTGFSGGRERIVKYWGEPHTKKERANFLKTLNMGLVGLLHGLPNLKSQTRYILEVH